MSSHARRHFTVLDKVSEHYLADRYRAEMSQGVACTPISLRLLAPRWCDQRAIVARLVDTAHALRQLRHPSIITSGGIVSVYGRPALITAPLSGAQLRRVFATAQQAGQVFPVSLVLSMAQAVASAMEHAHATLGLIHNSLSPSSIWLSLDGHLTLVHFEGAQSLAHRDYGDSLSFGTLSHMAPERILGGSPHPASDVYALGITLSTLLTGQPPDKLDMRRQRFEPKLQALLQRCAASLRSRAAPPQLHQALPDLLAQLLAYEPAERPSWDQLQDHLRTLSADLDTDSARAFCQQHCAPPPPLEVEPELLQPAWEDLPGG